MNKLSTTLGCVLLLLLAGCYLGDPVGVTRIVSLKLPVEKGQQNVSISSGNSQLQEALHLINVVLLSRGFVRDTNPPAANAQGLIVSYGDFCGVLLKDNKLDIFFVDYRSKHSSTSVKKTCDLLQEKLSGHYGAERVLVK